MRSKPLWLLWGFFFLVCAFLGFVRDLGGPLWLWSAAGLCFFVPPALLVFRARKSGDGRTLALIRYLAMASLGATALLLVLNFLAFTGSTALGVFLDGVLTIVSAPMMAMDSWALSLFLWACLLFAAGQKR